MKKALKIVLVIATALIIVTVLLVVFENLAAEKANIQVANIPTPTPTSTNIPTPTPTSTQASVPTQTSAPSITITYWNWTGPLGYDIMMRITITNHGYQSFEPNKTKFQVISSGKNFSYNAQWTHAYGDWTDPIISNGETYEGALAFNVVHPPTETITLVYVDTSGEYNITYIMK